MCFNKETSLFFAIMSTMVVIYKLCTSRLDDVLLIPTFLYTVMEITQYYQYKVIDQCSNKQNVYLTYFTWILEWIQPLMWNFVWYKTTTKNKEIFKFTILYSLIIFVLGIVRLFYSFNPQFKKRPELQSSNRTCTTSGNVHLKWENRTGHFKGLEPNWFAYMIMWFLPLIWLRPVNKAIQSALLFLIGIGASMMVTGFRWTDETPSIWCFLTFPGILSSIFMN